MVFNMKEFSLIAVAVFLVLGLSGLGSQLDRNIAGQAVANTDYDSIGTAGVYEVVEEESSPSFLSKLLAKDASVKKKFQIADGRCTQDSHCDGLETCEYSYCIDMTWQTSDSGKTPTPEDCEQAEETMDRISDAWTACVGDDSGFNSFSSCEDDYKDMFNSFSDYIFSECQDAGPDMDDADLGAGATTTSSEGGSEDTGEDETEDEEDTDDDA